MNKVAMGEDDGFSDAPVLSGSRRCSSRSTGQLIELRDRRHTDRLGRLSFERLEVEGRPEQKIVVRRQLKDQKIHNKPPVRIG